MKNLIVTFLILLTLSVFVSVQPVFAASKTSKGDTNATKHIQGTININTASVDALLELPGIGVKTAQSIVSYRNSNGKFKTVEDLMNVKGIGEKKFRKLRSHIST